MTYAETPRALLMALYRGTCLSVFQDTGQARQYLNRCEEGSGTWTKLINEDKHNLYSSPDMSVTLLKMM